MRRFRTRRALSACWKDTDRASTIPPNTVDLDTVLGLLKEQQDLQFERESKRQEEDRRALFKLEADKLTLELEYRREEQYKLELSDRKRTSIYQYLKIWDDTTEAEAYLQSFETSMQEADIREEDWLPILRKQLVGKALSIFMELSPREDTPYQDIKIDLLERLGSTPHQARRVIWLEKPKTDEDPRSFIQRTRKALSRIKPLITSTEDALNEMFQGVMLRNYSSEALLHISRKPNDSRYHKADALQELGESKGYYEKTRILRLQPQQPDRQQHQQRWRQNTWSGAQGRSSSTKKGR